MSTPVSNTDHPDHMLRSWELEEALVHDEQLALINLAGFDGHKAYLCLLNRYNKLTTTGNIMCKSLINVSVKDNEGWQYRLLEFVNKDKWNKNYVIFCEQGNERFLESFYQALGVVRLCRYSFQGLYLDIVVRMDRD